MTVSESERDFLDASTAARDALEYEGQNDHREAQTAALISIAKSNLVIAGALAEICKLAGEEVDA